MKLVYVLPTVALFALAGCDAAIAPSGDMSAETGFTRITTAEQFDALVVGKRLSLSDNYFVAAADGTLSGNFGGEALLGTWQWSDGYWCRTLTSHSQNTDCQLWAVSGNQHEVTRDRGNGVRFVYTVE